LRKQCIHALLFLDKGVVTPLVDAVLVHALTVVEEEVQVGIHQLLACIEQARHRVHRRCHHHHRSHVVLLHGFGRWLLDHRDKPALLVPVHRLGTQQGLGILRRLGAQLGIGIVLGLLSLSLAKPPTRRRAGGSGVRLVGGGCSERLAPAEDNATWGIALQGRGRGGVLGRNRSFRIKRSGRCWDLRRGIS